MKIKKSCPFCGGSKIGRVITLGSRAASCNECGATGPRFPVKENCDQLDDSELVAAWDRRVWAGCLDVEDADVVISHLRSKLDSVNSDLQRLIEFAAIQSLGLRDQEFDRPSECWKTLPDHLQTALNAKEEELDEQEVSDFMQINPSRVESGAVFICENIGVAGTTKCHVKETTDGKFEARIGIAIMGSTNMDDDGFEAANFDPFHDKFFDNYASGIGDTPEAAIEAMKQDMKQICDSLWAE